MMQLKWLAVLLVAILLSAMGVQAQDGAGAVLVVYQDEGVYLYVETTGDSQQLMDAAAIPAGAQVRASIAPGGAYVAVAVEQFYVDQRLPLDAAGQTIGELGLTNWLYIFAADGRLVYSRQTLPDDVQIDFFIELDNEGVGIVVTTYLLGTPWGSGPLLDWAPDGSRLLFAVGNDVTADLREDLSSPDRAERGRLVVFNVADESIVELPDTQGTPFDLVWSPDSRYVAYRSIVSFGTGAGYASNGTYVLGPQNTLVSLPLDAVVGDNYSMDTEPVGWLSETRFLFSMFNLNAGAAGLFVYDAEQESLQTVLSSEYYLNADALSIDEANGRFVVTTTEYGLGAALEANTIYVYDSPEVSAPRSVYTHFGDGYDIQQVTFTPDGESLVLNIRDANMTTFSRLDLEAGQLLALNVAGDGPSATAPPGRIYDNGIILVSQETVTTLYDPTTQTLIADFGSRLTFGRDGLRWLDATTYVGIIMQDSETIVLTGSLTTPPRTVFETSGNVLDVASASAG